MGAGKLAAWAVAAGVGLACSADDDKTEPLAGSEGAGSDAGGATDNDGAAEGESSGGDAASADDSGDDPEACAGLSTEVAPSLGLQSVYPRVFDAESTFVLSDAPPAFDVEVQIIRGDGIAWRAVVDASQTTVRLSDGAFTDASRTDLEAWKKHTVRARAYDGTCGRSEFSPAIEFRADDGSYALFHDPLPLEVELTLSDESYAAIAAEAKPEGQSYPFTRDYYTADVALNGAAYEGVGARVKGSGTARQLDEKAALKIHLSWDDPDVEGCAEERRHSGLKRVTLNNMVQDRTYLRETLGYQFYAALGLFVPRTQYANVYLNGEHMGFYLHVESVDRRFLARRFPSRKGMLYEAIYGGGRNCDLSPDKLGAPAEDNCFEASFSLDACDGNTEGYDATDHSHVHQLAEQIAAIPEGELYDALPAYFDIDRYLTQFAGEIVLGAGDSHFYHWNNYRIYHEPTEDRWHMIPTGIDSSFSPWLPPNTVNEEPVAYLAQRCLAETDCRAVFVETLASAMDLFDSMDFGTRMDMLIDVIADDVAGDTRGEFTSEEIDSARNSMRNYIENRRVRVEELIATWSAGR